MRALIVEDEILTALHLETVLEELGVESVGIAADVEGALRLAAAGPDLALVDMNLRDGLTGGRIAEQLARRGTAIFFVTANPRQIGEQRALALGVLDKPFDERQLEAAIDLVRAR
jgi:two-component system, response regulator PdtaR